MAALLSKRSVAMVAVVGSLASLVAMGSGVTRARLGTNVVSGLPSTGGPSSGGGSRCSGLRPRDPRADNADVAGAGYRVQIGCTRAPRRGN